MNNVLYVVMPAYNEEANIGKIIDQWHPVVERTGINSRLVIVNDGSTDKTYEIMKNLKPKYNQLIPITKANEGHGATCIFAYNYSINSEADYIFQTDSDGQTDPEEFWKFWNEREKYDFIIGYRRKRQDGFNRIMVTRTLRLLLLLIFGKNIKDPNTPFRIMNTRKLKPILNIVPSGFFLSNVLISTIAVRRKEKILWMPISFKPRQGGKNSINLKKIIKIGFKAIADFYQIKKSLRN